MGVQYFKVMIRVEIPHHAYVYVKAGSEEEAQERTDDFMYRSDEVKEYLYDIDMAQRMRTLNDPDNIEWRRTNTIADYDGAEVVILHPENP